MMPVAQANVVIEEERELTAIRFERLLALLGERDRLSAARRIVIKPNFACGSYICPSLHVVTDLDYLKVLAANIRRINPHAEIFIAESDSTGYGFAFLKFEHLGLNDWKMPGVKLLDLSRDRLTRVVIPRARFFTNDEWQLWLSETVVLADYAISVANLKTHSVTGFTGACKNLFGLLPSMNKEQYHTRIDDVIHDLVRGVRIQLSIVDGFRAMEENGPVQGIGIDLGCRVYGTSPVLVDRECCAIAGIDSRRVRHLAALRDEVEARHPATPRTTVRKHLIRPTKWLRVFNKCGLWFQAVGKFVYLTGHRVHCASSPLEFGVALGRPVLTKLFPRETLKRWKSVVTRKDV